MTLGSGDSLESMMHDWLAKQMLEFMSPVADVAYVLNPQWVNKSKDTGMVTMANFEMLQKDSMQGSWLW